MGELRGRTHLVVSGLAPAARRVLPLAEVEIVPGTGHSLNAEKADEVNTRVIEFLREADGAAAAGATPPAPPPPPR